MFRNSTPVKKAVIICVAVLVGVLLFPCKVVCSVPTAMCTSAPDKNGYIYRNYDVEPLGIMLLETVVHDNIPITYFEGYDSEKLDARQFPVQPYSQEEIETRARISLPKDIVGLESYVETGGMDDLIALRFSVSPLALYGTISRAGYVMPLERLDYVGSAFPMIGNKIPEWPTKEKWDAMLNDKSVILMGAHQPEAGFSRNIIVDETDPNMYTVYLVHWEL